MHWGHAEHLSYETIVPRRHMKPFTAYEARSRRFNEELNDRYLLIASHNESRAIETCMILPKMEFFNKA